jgi:hypothetical protein
MPPATSASALITVLRLIRDASATAFLLPTISATARRCRSLKWRGTTSKDGASPSALTSTPSCDAARSILRWILTEPDARSCASKSNLGG